MEEDTESCGSRASESSPPTQSRKRRQKVEVYHEVLRRLRDSCSEEASQPGFVDDLWAHFNRLPIRYALDVNVDRAQEVLMHKNLLRMAHDATTRPAIEVRLVQVSSIPAPNCGYSVDSSFTRGGDAQGSHFPGRQSVHPAPAFGLSPGSELALEANKSHNQDGNSSVSGDSCLFRHEITISTIDKPKLLSQLTYLLSEIGLDIQEAHAFSTTDGYSLDVFLVKGWAAEATTQLKNVLLKEILVVKKQSGSTECLVPPSGDFCRVNIPADGADVCELDAKLLKFEQKIATGSNGDLYKGTFCGQDVAIKVFKAECLNEEVQREFAQEVYILRKVRHKNVVQFIGACTRPPSFCIVTEFMPGGSVYGYLHKQMGFFKLPAIIKVAIDVSKGMNYLHQHNIIHRDLKAANLLMDENEVVKIADFGVARVQAQSGVMTAETGTYRWMAPEVIEHKSYDHKADVFSFGIVLWELLTGKLPYEHLTPLQAAIGVVQKGLRPKIPKQTQPKVVELLERCWQQNPSLRPEFSEIIDILEDMAKMVTDEERTGKKSRQQGEP